MSGLLSTITGIFSARKPAPGPALEPATETTPTTPTRPTATERKRRLSRTPETEHAELSPSTRPAKRKRVDGGAARSPGEGFVGAKNSQSTATARPTAQRAKATFPSAAPKLTKKPTTTPTPDQSESQTASIRGGLVGRLIEQSPVNDESEQDVASNTTPNLPVRVEPKISPHTGARDEVLAEENRSDDDEEEEDESGREDGSVRKRSPVQKQFGRAPTVLTYSKARPRRLRKQGETAIPPKLLPVGVRSVPVISKTHTLGKSQKKGEEAGAGPPKQSTMRGSAVPAPAKPPPVKRPQGRENEAEGSGLPKKLSAITPIVATPSDPAPAKASPRKSPKKKDGPSTIVSPLSSPSLSRSPTGPQRGPQKGPQTRPQEKPQKEPQKEAEDEPEDEDSPRDKINSKGTLIKPKGSTGAVAIMLHDDVTTKKFTISSIIGHRKDEAHHTFEVSVRWVSYDTPTWESERSIQAQAPELLYKYWKGAGGRPDNGEYLVFTILKHWEVRKPRKHRKYLVQWEGYSADDCDTSIEAEEKLREIAPEELELYQEHLRSMKRAELRNAVLV